MAEVEQGDDLNNNQGEAGERIRLSLPVNLDRDGFFRRACPSCGLEFKTEGDPADFTWALELQVRRVSDEGNADPSAAEEDTTRNTLLCPYCQHVAEAKEMHTEETVAYFKRIALREYGLPKLHKMLAAFSESLARVGRGGGHSSVSISSKYERPPLPPRPIYGPDAPDMMIVYFQCCGKRIKVVEGWKDISLCTYCKTRVLFI
jgi:hypothetical protein